MTSSVLKGSVVFDNVQSLFNY